MIKLIEGIFWLIFGLGLVTLGFYLVSEDSGFIEATMIGVSPFIIVYGGSLIKEWWKKLRGINKKK